jgi:hypothetical protein
MSGHKVIADALGWTHAGQHDVGDRYPAMYPLYRTPDGREISGEPPYFEQAVAAEIDRLRRWKAEATTVIAEWDAVWESIGRPGLGETRAAAVLAVVAASHDVLCDPAADPREISAAAIVDAVLARLQHRSTYPLADDHPDVQSYETATSDWRVTDHNLDRAITRAAEAHLTAAESPAGVQVSIPAHSGHSDGSPA